MDCFLKGADNTVSKSCMNSQGGEPCHQQVPQMHVDAVLVGWMEVKVPLPLTNFSS